MTESPPYACPTSPDTAIHILYMEWKSADLCDKCRESFKSWWEKPNAIQTDGDDTQNAYEKGYYDALQRQAES